MNIGTDPLADTDEVGLAFLAESGEPASYEEAIHCPAKSNWITAMRKEIDNLEKQGTFEITDLPKGKTALGGKWVYKLKTLVNGDRISHEHKARFVAQGFRQVWGRDYDEMHASVIRVETLRVVVAVVAVFGWELHQMDVVGAYLNGILEEELYMTCHELCFFSCFPLQIHFFCPTVTLHMLSFAII